MSKRPPATAALFANDPWLSALPGLLDQYAVISVDVFDTLLFRCCEKPDDVFFQVGLLLQKSMPESYQLSPETFRQLRFEAERRAHGKGVLEDGIDAITLERIYEEFSMLGPLQSMAMEAEIEVERRVVYINPAIYSFIIFCKELGKKVFLTSDFYFSKVCLSELLRESGFDMEYIDGILVSSEYGQTKESGELYRRLLELAGEPEPDAVLHIGDNAVSDIAMARIHGLHALLYPVVPRSRQEIFSMEKGCGASPPELASLRGLASFLTPPACGGMREKLWRRTGSLVLGPLYTFYAEWLLGQAAAGKLHHVLPFMREGELLARVIRAAAKHRGIELCVHPLYISRRATALAALPRVDPEAIAPYFHRPAFLIKDLLANVCIDVRESPFADAAEEALGAHGDGLLYDALHRWLHAPATLDLINDRVSAQRRLLVDYISGIIGDAPAMTVDMGHAATAQAGLSAAWRLVHGCDPFVHCLMQSRPGTEKHLLNGLRLRAWLGLAGENWPLIESVFNKIYPLEALVCAECGSTVGYRTEGKEIAPVLEAYSPQDDAVRRKEIVWQGIRQFQELWFMTCGDKLWLRDNLLRNKDAFLAISRRFCTMPLHEEAVEYGQLIFEDRCGCSISRPICTDEDTALLVNMGDPHLFLSTLNASPAEKPEDRVLWPEGVVAALHPGFFME